MDFLQIALMALYAFALVLVVMTCVGCSVLVERKVGAWMQGRLGPNRVSLPGLDTLPFFGRWIQRLGILQLPADAAKLLFKEDPTPAHVRKLPYFLAPCLALAPALIVIAMLPFGQYIGADGAVSPLMLCAADTGFLFMFAVSSLGIYGIILAGWAANSKYPFLGAVRGAAQLISYELTMLLAVLPVVLATASPSVESPLNLFIIASEQGAFWNVFVQPLGALLFLTAIFAESHRQPFDMPESASDLVGGFHTEYGGLKLGLFFVGEYARMLIGSALFILFFLGGWNLPFVPLSVFGALAPALGVAVFLAKLFCMVFLFVWVRWTLPRFRYDQVMRLGWRHLLPLALANFFVYFIVYSLWP
ncbi:MAG: NADH-quinone oxidoreductase subunit H [Puniceicoccales bacterium]|jgi:NADH-quinone oxidoreductase subunit H|nr:NADH-quinone oxidoreductase subunit H [Puniceicoccales bacterium]